MTNTKLIKTKLTGNYIGDKYTYSGYFKRTTTPDSTNLQYTRTSSGGYNVYSYGSSTTPVWTGSALPNCTSYCYGRGLEWLNTTSCKLRWSQASSNNAKEWFDNNKNYGDYQYYSKQDIYDKLTYTDTTSDTLFRNPSIFTLSGCVLCLGNDSNHVRFIEDEVYFIGVNSSTQSPYNNWTITCTESSGLGNYNWRSREYDMWDILNLADFQGVIILPRNSYGQLKKDKFPWVIFNNSGR